MEKLLKNKFLYALCIAILLPACSWKFGRSRHAHIVSNKAILSLLSQTNISHDGTLEDIVQKTQQTWLRPGGKERWEVEETSGRSSRVSPEALRRGMYRGIIPLLERVGCIHEVAPRGQQYTYVLFLGAMMSRVKKRLDYLVELFRRGVRFDKIIVLTGQRKLNPELEPIDASTETEMILHVFTHASMPSEMKKVPVHYVDTPQQKTASGALRRPNTGDTIREWQKTNPPPGSCLVISNQPHVLYQDAVVKTFLPNTSPVRPEWFLKSDRTKKLYRGMSPNTFTIETVGGSSKPPYNISVILDSLARFLYQENKRLQK